MASHRLVGGSEMARILGMTSQALDKGRRQGRFSTAGVGDKGHLYDPDVVMAEFEATRDVASLQNRASHMPPGMRGGRPSDVGHTAPRDDASDDGEPKALTDSERYMRARAAHEALKAKERDIAIKVRLGELIEKEQARKDGAELGGVLLGALQAWPSRLAPELASMKEADEHAFHEKLTREVNDMIIAIRAQLQLV